MADNSFQQSSSMDRVSELLLRAKNNDANALGELLCLYANVTQSLFGRYLGTSLRTRLGASDFRQEVWIVVQAIFPTFGGNTADEWVSWLYGVCRNVARHLKRRHVQKCRNVFREHDFSHDVDDSQRQQAVDVRDAGTPSPSSAARYDELVAWFDHQLADLPGKQGRAIRLVRLEGYSHADAAQVLGCSERAVKGLLERGVATLWERLQRHDKCD